MPRPIHPPSPQRQADSLLERLEFIAYSLDVKKGDKVTSDPSPIWDCPRMSGNFDIL